MQRNKLITKITSAADLMAEPIPGKPLVEISGDNSVLIENHYGVCAYTPEHIGVKVKYGRLGVYGSCLSLMHMTKERLIITGRIDRVELLRG